MALLSGVVEDKRSFSHYFGVTNLMACSHHPLAALLHSVSGIQAMLSGETACLCSELPGASAAKVPCLVVTSHLGARSIQGLFIRMSGVSKPRTLKNGLVTRAPTPGPSLWHGSLNARWAQDSQTSYVAALGLVHMFQPTTRGCCITFYDLTSEITVSSLDQCGSVGWALSCKPKAHRFNSCSGRMSGFWFGPRLGHI